MTREELTEKFGQTWDTKELQKEFEVLGFSYCICIVKRKSDGQKGTLDFQHDPRFYHSFVEA